MRISFIFFFLFYSWTLILAQDSLQQSSPIDSNLTLAPVQKTIDTLGVVDFSTSFEADILHIQAIKLAEQETMPQEYVAAFKINGEKKYATFIDNKGQIEHQANFQGELLKIESIYERCKVKGCNECPVQTHPNANEIICLEQGNTQLVHLTLLQNKNLRIRNIPLWWSIIPPLVAIFLALIFRQVLLALFAGILAGAWVAGGMHFSPYGLIKSLLSVIDHYIIGALNNSGHLSVVVFSTLIGGMVAIISRNGGMAGIVKKLSPMARSPRSTQFLTWLLGIAIFFDDYANTLIVGNTIRPMTDKFKISREKLAYLVDSTAAPVAAVAFITTWIGAELGYISTAMESLQGLESTPSPYSVFLSSLSYSFYSYFTLIFILFVIFTGKDFGPMLKAEVRARTTGKVFESESSDSSEEDMEELEPVEGAPLRWFNGFIPVFVVVFGTLLGLIDTGMQSSYEAILEGGTQLAHNGWSLVWNNLHLLDADDQIGMMRKLGILIGNSDSYSALLWASMSAVIIAIILTVVQRIMSLGDAIHTTVAGFKTMIPALLILILAWSLATTTEELSTADFLTTALGDSLSPYLVPCAIFILAAIIAFSTGSSWSTMAILYPIAIPMSWTISQNAGLDTATSMEILYNVIAVVLSASVLGDHCSPISDTTILSSLASNCNHIDHVRTQLPYALTVGAVSLMMTYASTAFGIPFFLNMAIGLGILFGILQIFGKKSENSSTT